MSFLNRKIISLEPDIFGLDLSDLSIKVLQLEREGDVERVRSFSSLEIPPGLIEDGKIIEKEKVAGYIREAIKKAGPKKVSSNKIICSLPESKAFLRIINIPKMGEEEAREAIKWEMEANIPLPIDQVYFDWQFLDLEAKGKINVLTAAVSKEIVDDVMETMNRAGLEVYGLEVESIASARSLVDQKRENKANNLLVVDLGAQRTSFIMVANGAPYFTSSIPFSSEAITDLIAKKLGIDKKEAEQMKINNGIEFGRGDNPIFQAVLPLLENLVNETQKTLDFYEGIAKENSEINRIILCGGGANLKGLIPYLAKRLAMEVEMGNPWANVNFNKNLPIINRENSVRYATVVGLALRGLNYYQHGDQA